MVEWYVFTGAKQTKFSCTSSTLHLSQMDILYDPEVNNKHVDCEMLQLKI